jgi:hypothetical protein
MTQEHPIPGISRAERLSDEGLQRLENHLSLGTGMSESVLAQWIRRYGDPARAIIKRHGQYRPEFDRL